MTGYIIQPWDFGVVQVVNATEYTLPLECFAGETGTVQFEGKAKRDYAQYLFRLEGLDVMWKITSAETGDAVTTVLTVTDQTGLLDGVITFPSFDNSVYSADLTAAMVSHIIGNSRTYSDAPDRQFGKYVYPYVGCKSADIANVLSGAGLQTADYLLFSRASSGYRQVVTDVYKLVCDVVACGAKLTLSTGSRVRRNESGRSLLLSFSEHNNYSATPIYFNDGHGFLQSESYDGDVCSAYIGIPSSPSSWPPYLVSNFRFYLNANMQTVQTYADQINGYTKVELCASSAVASENAAAAFAANSWKHKVEFASDKVYHLNQPVRLMLERGVLNTAISKVVIKSNDERYFYTCGELPQTAAQHIKANSWTYGQRLPHNPYKGQLVFV